MRDYARVIHCASFRRLQGKTQVFPGHESDFFRNRLTHSLEVSQIAESIALRLNLQERYFRANPIDTKLCATAGLFHDIGHPPFGHNGERALDDLMKDYGGFEGNAQSLRILSVLEKKEREEGGGGEQAKRYGLNLTYRTLAAAVKYDTRIPPRRNASEGLVKGYYASEESLVNQIKAAVIPNYKRSWRGVKFKTIECSIMDVADDIAYSTYDLEDCLKAQFLTPADILSSDMELLKRVARKVAKSTESKTEPADVLDIFFDIFKEIAGASYNNKDRFEAFVAGYEASKTLAENGYLRTKLSSQLVGEFINGVAVELDKNNPALSKAYLESNVHRKVEALKHYTFEATIYSARVKLGEFRGYEVVSEIFKALSETKGFLLMPNDVRTLYLQAEQDATARMRVICDFVAGMTDRYAIEFYGRLHSDSAQSMFKPI